MLQFWKKSSQKQKKRSNSIPASECSPPNSPIATNPSRSCPNSFDSYRSGPLASFDDEGLFDIGEKESPKEQSKLSKVLSDVLLDKAALGYFVQYLEARGGLPFVRCWLDIENFQNALTTVDNTKLEQLSNKLSPLASTKIEHDSLSVSTDCDSYTADTNSLYDYSTSTLSESKINSDAKHVPDDKSKLEVSSSCDRNVSDTSPKNNCVSKCSNKQIESSSTAHNMFIQEFIDDALRIFKKYVALEAPEPIKCPEQFRKEVIENICNTHSVINANCFDKVQKFTYDILEREYFDAFMGSDYFCKYQIDVLTSGNVVLDDILYNETALFYFMEFLEQEDNRNLLEFWLAATNFHQQLRDQKDFFDPIEAQNDAVVLYDKYFSLQAHCPLGFGDKVRFAVEQNICGENGLILECFHLPLKIIEQILEKNYLKPFLASQLFYKYLSELINAVQCNGYSTMYEKNKSLPSDCSSEKSFSTQSTFLAMEVPQRRTKKERGADMNIDTRELYDPDALWRRKKYHRLSFGRITELGKFETDFEPEPDKRTESKLKNVVKKFVNFDEDKTKEEMAWQVAEMIVKDITNVTLNEQKIYDS